MPRQLSKLLTARAEGLTDGMKVDLSFQPGLENYPLVITPKATGLILPEWVRSNHALFTAKLHKHGAVLFRGFDIDTVAKFQQFIDAFDSTPLEYKQRTSPRYEVAKNIYHSTTYPEDQSINMHSENSYAPNWAMKIIFCCIQPAEQRGETPIADNRLVVQRLSHQTKQKFLDKGVRYVRRISRGLGLSWQEVFQTDNIDMVEEECRRTGMEFEWEAEDILVLSWNNKAIYNHPVTKEEIWFNHAFFYNKYSLNQLSQSDVETDIPFNTFYGDGSEISREEIEEIRVAYEQATVAFPWEKGDVLFLDNMLMAHGRNPYRGERKVIVSMLDC